MPKRIYSELIATAHHEASHAVADVEAHDWIASVTIVADSGRLAHTRSLPRGGPSLKRAIALLAGYVAEVRYAPSRKQQARAGACADFELAMAMLQELGVTLTAALRSTETFVDDKWNAIARLAAQLVIDRTLDGEEVHTIIDAVKAGADASAALAELRALRAAFRAAR